jgi:hypothetical protein
MPAKIENIIKYRVIAGLKLTPLFLRFILIFSGMAQGILAISLQMSAISSNLEFV